MGELSLSSDVYVAWEGDSLEIVRSFPSGVRQDSGAELRRLQRGLRPLQSRPIKSLGAGVFEIKEGDRDGWYRILYLARVGNTIHVLHAFRKQSRKTSRNDLGIAANRLKNVRARLRRVKSI